MKRFVYWAGDWKDADIVQDCYLVYPEAQNIDSDEKINPYSQV